MLKRLLIAVFVLGLILAFSGTAFSDIPLKNDMNSVVKVNPSHPRFDQADDARPEQPAFKKPASALQKLPTGLSMPAPPLAYFCDDIDLTSGSPTWYWTIPDADGDDLFNMRFTSEDNFDCTLKVAWFLMYGSAMVGTPDMRAYLWDDDGFGFPGNKLDSVDILNADLPLAGLGWVDADFSSAGWVFSDGAEYHYGWTILPNAGGDVLAVISDDADGPHAGEDRSSEYYAGAWGTMSNDWGADYAFFITSELCCGEIPYSDCYTQDYAQNLAYFWRAPHQTYGDEEYSMRFDVGGPETLVSVDLYIYNDAASPSNTDVFGNNDIYITVYGDAGGLPDNNIIAQVTLSAGTYSAFPALTTVPFGIVLEDNFHVSFGTNAVFGSLQYESCLSSDGTDGTGRSASDWGGGTWVDMLSGWGADYNFIFAANMCKDEYSLCAVLDHGENAGTVYPVPDANPIIEWGQLYQVTGVECLAKEVTVPFYRHPTFDTGRPLMYTYNTNINFYTSVAGAPGVLIHQEVLTPADYAAAGYTGSGFYGTFLVTRTVPDIVVPSEFFIGVESEAPIRDEGIRVFLDGFAGPATSGGPSTGLWLNAPAFGGWLDAFSTFGVDEFSGLALEVKTCCIPFTEAACNPGSDLGWATYQGNQGRTGASELSIGDAWCDLNLNWAFQHPTQGVSFTGPAVFGDKVVCAFTTEFIVFNVASGATVYTLTSATGDGQLIGSQLRSTPTITTIDISGTPTDVMFIAGNTTNGVGAIDFNTGAVIWQRTVLTVGPGGLFGATRFTPFTLLNIAGDDVLYYATETGRVGAVNADDGTVYGGWATNPLVLVGSHYASGATDGSSLFYSTQTTATEGDVYSIDAATGAINWQLSSSGGLQASTIYASYVYPEGFRSGVAYETGRIFAVSWANDGGASDFPTDGVYYTINSNDGSLLVPAIATNRSIYSTPIVDANRVYAPTLSQWVAPTAGGNLIGFNKFTGIPDWLALTADNAKYYTNGFRTCEPGGVADLVFVFNSTGFLEVYNSTNGDQIFNRRIDHGGGSGDIGFAGAIAMAGDPGFEEVHILFADFFGDLYDFTKGADRQRLEVQTYHPSAPVSFGALPSLLVDFGVIATNTGCTDLTFNAVNADENPFGSTLPAFSAGMVRDDVFANAAKIASILSDNSFVKNPEVYTIGGDDQLFNVRSSDRENASRRFAAAIPPWLNSVVSPAAGNIVSAGDSINLILDVNQSLISRGPQVVYVQFDTDDPDFFLNDGLDVGPGHLPEVLVTVVGGCLVDTTTLFFGVGSANMQWVTNTGRLGTGDWTPHGFEIDGDDASYYQGSYIYGNDTYRLAMNTQDWAGGGGEADAWVSLQPDPNYCDNDCKPFLNVGVSLGAISSDGLIYTPITGDVVCKSWLDSMQNFDQDPGPGLAWDWSVFGGPFDDTLTNGLYVNSRVIGAQDVPELANFTLEIMDITERNGNNVDNWRIGHFFDGDVGSDSAAYSSAASAGWSYNRPAANEAWGSIKIPFGCGDASNGDWDFAPLINVHGLTGAQALFDINAYFDSAYIFLNNPPGFTSQAMSASDGEVHITIAGHNFAPNGTYSLGVANFGIGGLTNATNGTELVPVAQLINKWAGFGRGDVNDDGGINLSDIIVLAAYVNNGGPGPIPFEHLGDVNADGLTNAGDINYLLDYYFNCGPCPMGDWVL